MRKFEYGLITGERAKFVEKLYNKLCNCDFLSVDRVVLFGSVARNNYTLESDFDFAIVSDTLTEAKFMRSSEYDDVCKIIFNSVENDTHYICDKIPFGTNTTRRGLYESIEEEGILLYVR